MRMSKSVVVAGHICLDITPSIEKQTSSGISDIFAPGRLISVGDADIHTGGAVANTGLAMKILGTDVTLAGKIGSDDFGDMIVSIASKYDAASGLIRSKDDSTSYSVVLAVPGIDRIFLHNPGANNTFCADDLPMDAIRKAALFHFGYPPLMKRIYENEGDELVKILRTAQEAGAATSLDLAAVDPDTPAGKADWKKILTNALPYVDIFVPSIEELLFMLDRTKYEELRKNNSGSDLTEIMNLERDIIPLGKTCMDLGARIVLIKCGVPGMYYCTASSEKLGRISPRLGLDAEAWADKSGFETSFVPDKVLSGTGAGDTSVAAFLTSILNGCTPEQSVSYAAATGACCVSSYDALSGLLSFEKIDEKIASGWKKI
jgi:sugar/nucleoside kinase (ribokinase family)